MSAQLLSPIDGWRIDATSRQVALRISTVRSSDFSVAAREHGFLLDPEQAAADNPRPECSGACFGRKAKRRG